MPVTTPSAAVRLPTGIGANSAAYKKPRSMLRFLTGPVDEADERERRDRVLDMGFDLDSAGLEADEREGDGACEHIANVRGTV